MAEQEPFNPISANPFGNIGLASNPEPRCPCVLLLDVSGSMAEIISGETTDLGYSVDQDGKTYRAVSGGVSKIDLLNEGLKAYKEDLAQDALASQRVEVSVVTFGKTISVEIPFTIASDFNPPVLKPDGETPMAAAISKAIDLIKERKSEYRQNGLHYFRPWIFMITDGKPSCVREKNGDYYMNSNGLDEYIVDKCYNQAQQARKLHIPITTFMIANDPYLQRFVDHFTEANQGKAFYTGLKGLGEMIFQDYEANRKKKIK